VTATRNHFVCTNEEGKEISIEPKSVGPVDGKVEIKTEDIGTIRMDTEEGSFDKYEMTESQIAKLKKMLESSVTISSSEAEKLLLEKTLAVYPPLARAAHVQGIVVLRVMISKDGMVENLSVVSGHPMLTGAASNAVKTWRYKPYLSHGKPMEVETNVSVTFAYP
jgi:TonB family protein